MSPTHKLAALDPEQLRVTISNWLSSLASPETPSTVPRGDHLPAAGTRYRPQTRKRRRSPSPSPAGLRSPPLTAGPGDVPANNDKMPGHRTPSSSARNKKRRTDDDDATPRPLASDIDPPDSARMLPPSRSHSSTGQSDTSASSSRRSSPSKQMASLALRPDGIETRVLRPDAPGLPPQLLDIMAKLKRVHTGVGIISEDQEPAITLEARHNPAFEGFYPFMFAPAADRGAVGLTPSVTDVRAVYTWAGITDKLRAGEDNWNMNVHSTLLKLALHGGAEHRDQLLDFQSCTSTPLIPSYIRRFTSSKRVDFVIVLNPDKPAQQRIEELRTTLPELSINHCSHESLYRRPVAVSIETKKDGASDREAQLQVGTWLAAQFNLLRDLVGSAAATVETEHRGGDDEARQGAAWQDAGGEVSSGLQQDDGDVFLDNRDIPQTDRSVIADNGLNGLPFLPAIIVHGHDWVFSAATLEGQKTVLWTDWPFGSTRDALGIYKVVAGIQHIVEYVEGTFWPWYKDAVLGIETPEGS